MADASISVLALARTLRLNPKWSNPTGEWRVGLKRAYELFPKTLVTRVKEERRKDWDKKHLAAEVWRVVADLKPVCLRACLWLSACLCMPFRVSAPARFSLCPCLCVSVSEDRRERSPSPTFRSVSNIFPAWCSTINEVALRAVASMNCCSQRCRVP